MTSNEELGYKALDVAMEILREFQKENPDLTKQEQNYIVESAEKAWLTLAIATGKEIEELKKELVRVKYLLAKWEEFRKNSPFFSAWDDDNQCTCPDCMEPGLR